jgi:hypothetical protein
MGNILQRTIEIASFRIERTLTRVQTQVRTPNAIYTAETFV